MLSEASVRGITVRESRKRTDVSTGVNGGQRDTREELRREAAGVSEAVPSVLRGRLGLRGRRGGGKAVEEEDGL